MTEFGREYGEGLYALCAEEKLEASVLQELQALKTVFHDNPDFVKLLANMSISKEERVGIVDQTLKSQVHEYVLNFLKLLVERGGMHEFSECAAAYQENYNRDHGVAVAEVTTARPLNEQQRANLLRKLGAMTGKEIVIKEKVDPALLGGVLLQLDGRRYDNTLLGRLNTMKQSISGD